MQPDPLQQLRDVHLPEQPGWWPPAPGWWLLALTTFCVLGWISWRLWRSYQRQRPFRSAQLLHQQLCNDLQQQKISTEQYLHEANGLLKRAFVHALGEHRSAAMTGNDWLGFLNQFVDGEPFSGSAGQLLSRSRFAPNIHSDATALTDLQTHVAAALETAATR